MKLFICSTVHAFFKKLIPPVMFFWAHPMHRRNEQIKLMDKQINKMFEHGTPPFFFVLMSILHIFAFDACIFWLKNNNKLA